MERRTQWNREGFVKIRLNSWGGAAVEDGVFFGEFRVFRLRVWGRVG